MHLNILGSKLSAQEVRDALETLPSNPGDAYAEMWERIEKLPSNHANLAKSILGWITFSKRSLSLEELQIALAIPRDSPLTKINEEMYTPRNTLIELCLGLVVINKGQDTIRFVRE